MIDDDDSGWFYKLFQTLMAKPIENWYFIDKIIITTNLNAKSVNWPTELHKKKLYSEQSTTVL